MQNDSEDDEEKLEENSIEWRNLIFLQFHPLFRGLLVVTVVIKAILGPLSAIMPKYFFCHVEMESRVMDLAITLNSICVTPLILIDLFLHSMHRQLTDIALQREHLPKSQFLMFLDVIGIIPLYQMLSADCPTVQMWPNILSLQEILLLYRVGQFFSLSTTHSLWRLVCGFTVFMVAAVNALTCFWLLYTVHGLCERCTYSSSYDWRYFVNAEETDHYEISFYLYSRAAFFLGASLMNLTVTPTRSRTYMEMIICNLIQVVSYLLLTFLIRPRLFCVALLRLRKMTHFQPQVNTTLMEAKMRTNDKELLNSVANFYRFVWLKRDGLMGIPKFITFLPTYLEAEVKGDLVWPVFYHSPIFRKTSESFRRYLALHAEFEFRIPGDSLLSGNYLNGDMIYLKQGVVQFTSSNDNRTPLLTVRSGTLIGDVNFLMPPTRCKLAVRCVTFCKVYVMKRETIINTLHLFPDDRESVLAKIQEKFNHARDLYSIKKSGHLTDIVEQVELSWLKDRWAQLSHFFRGIYGESNPEIPCDEIKHHCSKYIGQINLNLQGTIVTKKVIRNQEFPWILEPSSEFLLIWEKIVKTTVLLVFIIFPPCLMHREYVRFFDYFKAWAGFIYILDMLIVLCIPLPTDMITGRDVVLILYNRLRTLHFLLNFLSTPVLSTMMNIMGLSQHSRLFSLFRLLKVYIFFSETYATEIADSRDNLKYEFFRNTFLFFAFVYASSYTIHMMSSNYLPGIEVEYFFCKFELNTILSIPIAWSSLLYVTFCTAASLKTVYLKFFVSYVFFCINAICKCNMYAVLYFQHRDATIYQHFSSSMMSNYKKYGCHPYILKRMVKYTECYWKLYRGLNLLQWDNILKDEPYEMYYKIEGQFAEEVILHCTEFFDADINLVKDIAFHSKFKIFPKFATLDSCGSQCDTITWLVSGHVTIEYYDRNGGFCTKQMYPGQVLSTGGTFLGKLNLRTFVATTDCEVLYIDLQKFRGILENYPDEKRIFEKLRSDFGPAYNKICKHYIHKYKKEHLQSKIIKRQNSKSRLYERIGKSFKNTFGGYRQCRNTFEYLENVFKRLWINPSQRFMRYWFMFRAIIAVLAVTVCVDSGSAELKRRFIYTDILNFCDAVAVLDMIIKLFLMATLPIYVMIHLEFRDAGFVMGWFCSVLVLLAYYNEKGLLIYCPRKRIAHYLSTVFIMDLIGVFPFVQLHNYLNPIPIMEMESVVLESYLRSAHLYIFLSYCNYLSDLPKIKGAVILLVKWQIIAYCFKSMSCQRLLSFCYNVHHDSNYVMKNFSQETGGKCIFYRVDNEVNVSNLEYLQIFGRAAQITQLNYMGASFGKPTLSRIGEIDFLSYLPFLVMDVIFWYISLFSIILLFLFFRSSILLREDLNQLVTFLERERVEQALINRVRSYFKYWWIRTNGVKGLNPLMLRMGTILRQDTMMWFYKGTLGNLGTLIGLSSNTKKMLSTAVEPMFFLPGSDIMREMRIMSFIYIVHRGRVVIIQNEKTLATLTPGAIFGQLSGSAPRGVLVTARADEHADILSIPVASFRNIVSNKVKATMAEIGQNDYIAMKTVVEERPENTILYLTRGTPAIFLPGMKAPWTTSNSRVYSWWLQAAWLWFPALGALASAALCVRTPATVRPLYIATEVAGWLTDLLFLVYLVTNYLFSVRLIVKNNTCVQSYERRRKLKQWLLYLDVASLVSGWHVPYTRLTAWYVGRLLRLRHFALYRRYFCKTFRRSYRTTLLYFFCITVILVWIVSIRIIFMCQDDLGNMKTDLPQESMDLVCNPDECVPIENRKIGCIIYMLFTNNKPDLKFHNKTVGSKFYMFRPKNWFGDFLMSASYIFQFNNNYYELDPEELTFRSWWHLYLDIHINYVIFSLHICLTAKALEFMYLRMRKILIYDYEVANLLQFLRLEGISSVLSNNIKKFCNQLWEREAGNWLPELAQAVPPCLHEDLLCATYFHHFSEQRFFEPLPEYFLRQLTAKFRRTVIFPGVDIVKQGDILPKIFFIHEGEVEKYYITARGEKRVLTVLTTNAFFGFLASIDPAKPYSYTYSTRTVVDLIYLKHKDWKCLLDAYPDVNDIIVTMVKKMRRDVF